MLGCPNLVIRQWPSYTHAHAKSKPKSETRNPSNLCTNNTLTRAHAHTQERILTKSGVCGVPENAEKDETLKNGGPI